MPLVLATVSLLVSACVVSGLFASRFTRPRLFDCHGLYIWKISRQLLSTEDEVSSIPQEIQQGIETETQA